MTRKKALSQARTRRRLYPTAVRMVVILHDDLLHQRVVALRAPSMYSSWRSSSPAMVAAEIMPRSATMHTRAMAKAGAVRPT